MNDDDLGPALRRQADRLTDSQPLTLDDVKGRAGSIRRRRTAAAGLAAAAVLAVAVPAGLALDDRLGNDDSSPPVAGTPTPTPTAGPTLLDLAGAPLAGPAPVPVLDGGDLVVDADTTLTIGRADTLDRWTGGYVTYSYGDTAGSVRVLDAAGEEMVTDEATSPPVVSPDGSVVAWVRPGGEAVSWTEADGVLVVGDVADLETPQIAAVLGSGSCQETGEKTGCTLWVDDRGREARSVYVTSHGIRDDAGFRSVVDVDASGAVAGVVSATDDGSCSEVRENDGTVRWSSCDLSVGSFSPDGSRLIGRPAYLDGLGDGEISILDAADGSVVAQWRNDESTQSALTDTVWASESSLLSLGIQGTTWYLVRLDDDASLSQVTVDGRSSAEDDGSLNPPWRLP